jgi:ribosomal 50S subunit-associated protein YjgA (DUF615 family)
MQEEIKETTSPIDDARQILEQIEKAKAENQAMLERMEQLRAESMLSGKSSASIPAPAPISKEQEIRERVNKLLSPTGMKI